MAVTSKLWFVKLISLQNYGVSLFADAFKIASNIADAAAKRPTVTSRTLKLFTALATVLAIGLAGEGQTTLHLRDEASTIVTSNDQLTITQPDTTAVAVHGADLKNLTGTVVIKRFETQTGVPGINGVMPANSLITFNLWMKTSVNSGSFVAYANLSSTNPAYSAGCFALSTAALTTTLTKFTFTCNPGGAAVLSADRFQLDVGVSITRSPSKSTIPEVDVEGSSDSQVVIPALVAPGISSLSVTSGDIGTSVSIFGSNFGPAQGAGTVTFNGVSANPSVWSSSEIDTVVPNNTSTGPVVVTSGGLQSNGVTFTVPPAMLTGLSQSSGSTGTSITLSGSHFGNSQAGSTVTFNGSVAVPTSWNSTTIVVPVPNSATDGPVVVTVGGVASNGLPFTVLPGITSMSPVSGAVGTAITINGSNFGGTQGTSTVTFNGVPGVPTSWSTASIGVAVPAGASTGPVVVTVNSTTSSKASNGVTFTVPLYISSITPAAGAVRAPVSIRGSSFGAVQGTSTLTFNGTAASPSLWNDSQIIAPVPPAVTTGPLVVTVGGTAVNGGTFTVNTIGSVSGIITRLSDGAAVSGAEIDALVGGAIQSSTTSAANGTYTLTNLTPGTYDIRVSATGYGTVIRNSVGLVAGVSATVSVALSTPAITGLFPSSGPAGTLVTIRGLYFGPTISVNPLLPNSTVVFGGVPASPSAWSDTTITVPVPAGVSTGPVVVTVGGAASNGATFTVGTGTIAGTISRASDSTAISGVLVEVLQSNAVKASVNTASDGTYLIANLTPGSYDIRISANSYGTTLITGNLVSASVTTTVNASLAAAGTISGKVTKSDGVTAISGASVTVVQSATTVGTATSDANGNYSIASLNAGSYSVQGSAGGYNSQTQTGIAVTSGAVTTVNFSLVTQAVITYDYDQLGRLVGVTDSTGNSAAYHYDAVGNILSISNTPSTQVSIINFDPSSGPVGTTVTISGTGFSATASQDTVKFNGTVSTVNSSTATQIVAVVPSGATTGTISVTAPGGSASSASTFAVTADSGVPTITSFTPTMGTTGTVVAITGTHFDAAPFNDRLQFNATFADITSATSIILNTTVPGPAASGHIAVGTTAGTAVSTQDFFVPFGSHVVGDIGFTGRMLLGGTQSVAINTAGKIALVLFDATAGQKVSAQTSSGTFSSCTLFLFDPYGNQLTSVNCSGASSFMDGQSLPVSGTYTMGIDPGSTTGSLNLTLNNANDVIGSIASGAAISLTTTVPGQNARYTFSGTVGQLASVSITNSTYPGCTAMWISILKPDGSMLGNNNLCGNWGFLDSQLLPVSGVYTVVIDPVAAGTGSATVLLSTYNDVTGPITPGAANSLTTTSPGQNARYTFSGTVGQLASVSITNSTYPGCTAMWISILKPDGSTLGNNNLCGTSGFLDSQLLPVSGVYTVLVDPVAAGTGSASVLLSTYNDVTGSITVGTPINVTTTVPGQDARYTFSGATGQSVSISVTNSTYPGCSAMWISILKPDGSTLGSNNLCGTSGSLNSLVLPAAGNYTVLIDPVGAGTGSATVALNSP